METEQTLVLENREKSQLPYTYGCFGQATRKA